MFKTGGSLFAILALTAATAADAAPAVPLSLASLGDEPQLNDCMEGQEDIDDCVDAYGEHFIDSATFRREMETMRALQSENAAVRAANAPSPALTGLIERLDEVSSSLGLLSVSEEGGVERLAERASRIMARMRDLEDRGKVSSRRHVRLFHRADRVLRRAEDTVREYVGVGW